MVQLSVKFLLVFTFSFAFCWSANAQGDASTRNGRPRAEELPTNIQESLAKGRIKRAEKEYQELLERGEEAARLGEEIGKALESGQKLSTADKKKLERLERLVKRIRTDLGGQDDDQREEKDRPLTVASVVKNIQEDTASLLSEIKKIGRHTISVIAIESSNSLLKLIKFLRFNTN